jgi:hypothetical protein
MPARKRDAGSSSLVSLVRAAEPRPLKERGRVFYAEDVIALLASHGRIVSRWWVNHKFAPDLAFEVGRANAWWEVDVLAWLDAQRRAPSARRAM